MELRVATTNTISYMKLGQTSLVIFFSKLVTSAFGFLATLYIARELGPEVIGVYTLILTIVTWLFLFADFGVGEALVKRLSEEDEQGEYLTAAVVWLLLLALCMCAAIMVGQSYLNSYITEFDQYVAIPMAWFMVAYIFSKSLITTITYVIEGERKVHIAGIISSADIGGRSLLQIGLVFLGFGLFGMIIGAIAASVLAGIVGITWVTVRPARPAKRHFRKLFNYAKFSWLGNLQARTFNDVDLLILGIFVQTSFVGVYSVAWSLSKFLDLFGTAIRSTLFPELSYTSAQESKQAAAGLVQDSLAYSGLIAIPGLIGGVILRDRLLGLYGEEFTGGATVLGFLILAVLLFSYQKQLLNGLNGFDYPNLAFQVNAVFITLNAGLNLALISRYGIEGAAIASVVSIALSLILSYYLLSQLVAFAFPWAQIARQWVAALAMGLVLLAAREVVEMNKIIDHNVIIVASLVCLGAGVYFLTLLAISPQLRTTAGRNIPINLSFLN